MKKAFLTYTVLTLIAVGGAYASYKPSFAPLYSVFVYGILGAKAVGHASSLTGQFLDNQAAVNGTNGVSTDISLTPISPSTPVLQNPIGPVND